MLTSSKILYSSIFQKGEIYLIIWSNKWVSNFSFKWKKNSKSQCSRTKVNPTILAPYKTRSVFNGSKVHALFDITQQNWSSCLQLTAGRFPPRQQLKSYKIHNRQHRLVNNEWWWKTVRMNEWNVNSPSEYCTYHHFVYSTRCLWMWAN